ncbi:MAG: glycosyltransferase family 4 protein [Deltaproteobacteria bacterium]|nr:glycosyltransferase family 4 protein [Deltaproteobacteria bacterium]
MSRRGVFVFSYPVLEDGAGLYFGDECHRHTIELCRPYLDEIAVVARRRRMERVSGRRSLLSDLNARLQLELPEFGLSGSPGWVNILRLALGRDLKKALYRLLAEADFVYVDAPSIEAGLTARAARRLARPLTMEMRGEVLLNRHYMQERFGRKGLAYVWLLQRLFGIVRKQAVAGLYLNRSLLQRYPVNGPYREAISDVRLPDQAPGEPKRFAAPARHFLYVGSLEKIKQVDTLVKALGRIRDRLPADWTFQIVGDGPEMQPLIGLGERLGLSDHLFFPGRVEWGDPLFALYRKSDLLLMASRSEGASRTLLEAMAFGLPIISTEVGTAPELLDPRALVKTGRETEYAQRLIAVAAAPELLTDLSGQNWQRSQEYRLPKLQGRREAFYARAIELSSPGQKGSGLTGRRFVPAPRV